MKVFITSVNCCIPLTKRQWTVLRQKEDSHNDRTEKYVFFPTTWKFPKCDKVDQWEWNGHFGRNIFFRAEGGAEKYVVKFLEKYLQ